MISIIQGLIGSLLAVFIVWGYKNLPSKIRGKTLKGYIPKIQKDIDFILIPSIKKSNIYYSIAKLVIHTFISIAIYTLMSYIFMQSYYSRSTAPLPIVTIHGTIFTKMELMPFTLYFITGGLYGVIFLYASNLYKLLTFNEFVLKKDIEKFLSKFSNLIKEAEKEKLNYIIKSFDDFVYMHRIISGNNLPLIDLVKKSNTCNYNDCLQILLNFNKYR